MAGDAPAQDRRRNQRYDVAVRVHVAQLGVVNGGLAHDISEGGLFIETAVPYPPGHCMPLRLIHTKTALEIPTICEVVRHVRNDVGKMVGLGLRFVNLDKELIDRIRGFIGDLVAEPVVAAPSQLGATTAASAAAAASEASEVPEEVSGAVPLDSVPLPRATVAGLQPQLIHVLSLVDGRRTADEVARASGLSVSEALGALRQLAAQGCVHIQLDLSDVIIEVAGPVTTEEQVAANRPFVDERARDYLANAVRAERAGRLAEAVNLLEQALVMSPGNAADIHIRIVRLALGSLENVQLARLHLTTLRRSFPEYDGLAALENETAKRDLELQRARVKKPSRRKWPRIQTTPLRAVAGSLLALTVVAAIGWALWLHVLPRGPQPSALAVTALPDIGKVESAQVFEGCLFVKVAWPALSREAKTAHLQKLAAWVESQQGVREVVVSDSRPVMLGQVKDGIVTVH